MEPIIIMDNLRIRILAASFLIIFAVACGSQIPRSPDKSNQLITSELRFTAKASPNNWLACPGYNALNAYAGLNNDPAADDEGKIKQQKDFLVALRSHDLEKMKALIQAGVNPNCYFVDFVEDKTYYGVTALCVAIKHYARNIQNWEHTEFYFDTIQTLLENGSDPNARCSYSIYGDRKPDPSDGKFGEGSLPLTLATNDSFITPDLATMTELLKHGADASLVSFAGRYNQPLPGRVVQSIVYEYLSSISNLFFANTDINSHLPDSIKGLDLLIENGSSVGNISQDHPYQPIYKMSYTDAFLPLTEILIKNGANPSAISSEADATACHAADEWSAFKTLALFKSNGFCQ
jgi:hypothetical protein